MFQYMLFTLTSKIGSAHESTFSLWRILSTIVLVCFVCLTIYHRLGGLNNRHVFLPVLEAGVYDLLFFFI